MSDDDLPRIDLTSPDDFEKNVSEQPMTLYKAIYSIGMLVNQMYKWLKGNGSPGYFQRTHDLECTVYGKDGKGGLVDKFEAFQSKIIGLLYGILVSVISGIVLAVFGKIAKWW
ncbi:MAG: hypothetical protein PHY56_00010 [Candidatus Omnitrophica bacterium]|nr:hypothetical protein [Candidatus Omnitrophota bacterium]